MSTQINSSTINETFIIEGQDSYSGDCSAIYTDLIESCGNDFVEIGSNLKLSKPVSADTITSNSIDVTDYIMSKHIISEDLSANTISATTLYGDGSYLTGIDTSFTSKFVVKSGDTMTGQLKAPSFSAVTYYGDGSNLTGIVGQINGKFVHLSGDTMTGQLKVPSVSATTYLNINHNDITNRNSLNSHPASAITNNSLAVSGSSVNEVFDNSLDFVNYSGSVNDAIKILSINSGSTVLITSKDLLNYINNSNAFVNTTGDTMTGQLTLPTISASTYLNIDHNNSTNNKQGGQSGQYYHLNQSEYNLVSGNSLDNRYVNVTGDTLTGQLKAPSFSATTYYGSASNLTDISGVYLPLSGGSITGVLSAVTMSANTFYGDGSNLTGIINQVNAKFLPLSGGTLTGGLSGTSILATTFYGNGSNLTNIDHNTTVNKQGGQYGQYYHLNQSEYALVSGNSLDNRYVNVTGDTITGLLKSTSLSSTTLSATTIYGDGSNITGIVEQINGKFVHLSGDTLTGQLKAPSFSAITYYGNGGSLSGISHTNLLDRNTINSHPSSAITNNSPAVIGGSVNEVFDNSLDFIDNTGIINDNLKILSINSGSTVLVTSKKLLDYINNSDTFVNTSGDTINGLLKSTSLSATTITGGTLYGDGSNLTGIVGQINGKFVHLSGDTMTGQLKVPNLSATTITGTNIYGNGANITGLDHNTVITGKQGGQSGQYFHLNQSEYSQVSGNTLDLKFVNTTGDTMTGELRSPSFSATTMTAGYYYGSGRYLSGLGDALGGTFVRITGDIMTGGLKAPSLSSTTLSITGDIFNPNGEVTVNDDLKVTGNLIVLGDTVTVNTEQLLVEDNLITLNIGETGSTVTKGISGIEIDRGTGSKYQFLFVESADTFNIGVVGNLQPVATREAMPLNGGYAVWDSVNSRFNTTNNFYGNTVTATVIYGNGSNITGLDHNNTIINKQGGQSGQYYHLTQYEYALVSGNSLDNRYVNVTGDTMTGQLKAPSISATTLYGDGQNITGLEQSLAYAFVNISGDTMTGQLNLPALSADTVVARLFIGDGSGLYNLCLNSSLSTYFVSISGSTMTGNLVLPSLVANNDITIRSLSGTTTRSLSVDSSGKIIVGSGGSNNKITITGVTTSVIVDSITDNSIDACVWDYVVKSSTGIRSGTVTGVWNLSNSTFEYYEVSTNDIGNTSGVTLSVSISGLVPKLIMTVTSGNWSIKALASEL